MRQSNAEPVAVVGAGGHAKVVISALRAAGYRVAAAYDDNPAVWGSRCLGVLVRGPIEALNGMAETAAVLAIGNNATRREVAERLGGMRWLTLIHPAASVDPTAEIGPGTVVCAGAVIQPDARIGAHVIVNTSASVDHDCVVEEYAHLAPGVHLAGGVWVGRGAFLGIGSSVIPGRRVGEWTILGAGGVVVRDLPEGVTAVGVPARLKEERQWSAS